MNRLSIFGILFVSSLFMAVYGFGKMGMMPYYGGYGGAGMMMAGGGMGMGGGGGYGGVWSFLVFSKILCCYSQAINRCFTYQFVS